LGTIRFNGNWYLNQDFYYDCEDDAIILKDREGYFRIELIREKTESFQLAGHRFVKLKLLSPYGEFYEEAFKGKRTLLVRWKKTLETNNEAMNKYKLTKQFFVMYDEKSFEIKKANDLFDILGNQAKPARHWMKAQGINLKKDMLAGILSTFQHFESLGW
jgi:hypothetical protein